jgi:hypothetical protein
MVRRAVLILLSVLLIWNLVCGFIWVEAAIMLPLTRASNEHGHIEDVEERLQRMEKAEAAYREQSFEFSANLVMIALAVNVASLVAALGLILSPSMGWPGEPRSTTSGGRESIAATTFHMDRSRRN